MLVHDVLAKKAQPRRKGRLMTVAYGGLRHSL